MMKQILLFIFIVFILAGLTSCIKNREKEDGGDVEVKTTFETEEEEDWRIAEKNVSDFLDSLRLSKNGGEDNLDLEIDAFPHQVGNLFWSEISIVTMKQSVAEKYCQKLGGKLPGIGDLRSLIKNCPTTEKGGKCGVTNDCTGWIKCRSAACGGCRVLTDGSYSVFGDRGWLWSSSGSSESDNLGWLISFEDGFIYATKPFYHRYVRCAK